MVIQPIIQVAVITGLEVENHGLVVENHGLVVVDHGLVVVNHGLRVQQHLYKKFSKKFL